MNESDDKPLHDWVRQSLQTYRPGYDPQEWQRMQRRLQRRRWWRTGLIGSISLLLLSAGGWFWVRDHTVRSGGIMGSQRSVRIITDPIPVKAVPEIAVETPKLIYSTPKHNTTGSPPLPEQQVAGRSVAFLEPNRQPMPLPVRLHTLDDRRLSVAFSPEEPAIQQQMLTGNFGTDSTSFQTLNRNIRQWPDAVVVCDLTSSMYPYSTQLFAWLRQNAQNPSIKGIVFFTDCDSLGQQTRPGGPPGRMFVIHERGAANALPIMLNAARNTLHNTDDAENDVEALLFAQKTFPEAKHLILVADNISTVKDLNQLGSVRKPVHVVLCGTTGSTTAVPFQPDYFAIASRTSGSLHTLEDDLNPNAISRSAALRVGTQYYRYRPHRKQFKLTRFDHRPVRFLGLFWL